MASTISAGTTSGTAIAISGDTSGNLAFQTQAGANTITVPNATGTVMVSGNMPAFSYYLSSTQSITTSTTTKILFDTKTFDTNNNFSSNRFTPTVAGYYQINMNVIGSSSSYSSIQIYQIYKNGNPYVRSDWRYQSAIIDTGSGNISAVIYFNGSTDYVEGYAYIVGTSPTISSSLTTQFSGCLVRAS